MYKIDKNPPSNSQDCNILHDKLSSFLQIIKSNIYTNSNDFFSLLTLEEKQTFCKCLFEIFMQSKVIYDKFMLSHNYFESFLFSQNLIKFDLNIFNIKYISFTPKHAKDKLEFKHAQILNAILKKSFIKDNNIFFYLPDSKTLESNIEDSLLSHLVIKYMQDLSLNDSHDSHAQDSKKFLNVILHEPFNQFIKETISKQYENINFFIASKNTKTLLLNAIKLHDLLSQKEIHDLLLECMISYALIFNASDIHLVLEDEAQMMLRIDGNLISFLKFSHSLFLKFAQKLRLICNLDINNIRLPQDGRFRIDNLIHRAVDVRISFYPTISLNTRHKSLNTQSIVMRIPSVNIDRCILNEENNNFALNLLFNNAKNLNLLKEKLLLKSGLILISGPTGSGKSTLLYSILKFLNHNFKKIISIEDPVEQEIENVAQSQVNEDIGFDFYNALKFILRQDPDVIMIGEIRDEKTLSIALRAAISGHLVLASIHSNDCISSIDRLQDLGAKEYLIKSSLRLLISLRLLKKLCPNCKEKLELLKDDVKNNIKRYNAKGCANCYFSGYSGRVMIEEMLDVDLVNDILFDKMAMKEFLKNHENFIDLKSSAKNLYDNGAIDYNESLI